MCTTFVYDAFPLREFARTLVRELKIVCNFVSKLREVFLFEFYNCFRFGLLFLICLFVYNFVFEFYKSIGVVRKFLFIKTFLSYLYDSLK